MNAWINFWMIFLIFGLALFAVVAVVVTIRGFGDLKDLLRQDPESPDEED